MNSALNPQDIARHATAKSYDEHGHKFSNTEFGNPLNIKTEEEFSNHILDTLKDSRTRAFQADNGRKLYYNKHTNTAIWQSDKYPDRCTCFRPHLNDPNNSDRAFQYLKRTVITECNRMKIL